MRVAILGCGYVGLELGRQLRDDDHDVVGVRRSDDGLEQVGEAGLEPVRADVTDGRSLSSVPAVEAVVFSASSGGRGADAARSVYIEGVETVIDHFGARATPPTRLVYTSSTGVYGDHDGDWVDEETSLSPGTEKARVLVRAEEIALEDAKSAGIEGTVARFGGLYGPGRLRPERYLDGPVTEGVLNLIHRDDAAGAIRFLLERNLARGEVVNVVDDEPVEKWRMADWLAEQVDREPPPKQTLEERLAADELSDSRRHRILAQKRVRNTKLRDLGYSLAYPTFREGFGPAIDQHDVD